MLVNGFPGRFLHEAELDEFIGLIDILGSFGKRHAVHPGKRSLLGGLVGDGFSGALECQRRSVPGLADNNASSPG